jgi:4-amino-4-deoxy-L-arabinose transferase-like glycosyltransferase
VIASAARRPLAILLTVYVLLAGVYSVVTPIFEASDEVWHYPMVRYMAQNALAIPVQTPGIETPWRQEGSQPPLYYMLAALLTGWIDTTDFEAVRRINPHADIGVVVPDGNANMTIHDPAARGFPWHGTTLAVYLARCFSVTLGALTVLMTYRLARALFPAPDQHGLALASAAFTAFNPMFLFISGSVNNDNLSNALASVLLVLIARLLTRTDRPSWRELAMIGVLAGAGMLAKFNIGFLLPIIAVALALLARRLRDVRFFLTGAILTGGLTILIAGWWYVRNWTLYGDPTGLNVFIQIVGPRAIPANWAQLWAERHTFLMSYWGFFGGVNVPLPELMYTIFNAIAALAAVGIIGYLVTALARRKPSVGWPLLAARAVSGMWIAVLFAGLLRWTSETWASQGRLMFSAIAPISMWMAVGLWWIGGRLPGVRWRLAGAAVCWFGAVAVISPAIIGHAYTELRLFPDLDTAVSDQADLPATFVEPGRADSAPVAIVLDGATLPDEPLRPGEYVRLCADLRFAFSPSARFTRDWSAFIHLETPSGVILAQRDVYLRQGQLATSLLSFDPGQALPDDGWRNCFAVRLPDHPPTPHTLDVYLGFYELRSGDRMRVEGQFDGRVRLGAVRLLPRDLDAPVPNPMQVDFGGEAELIGYEVSPGTLTLHPGDPLAVTLYWRALRPMTNDYRVFVQVVEPNTTRVFAQSDAMPAGWIRPTSGWSSGEIIEDRHTLTISADAAPGTWQIIAGMYDLREMEQGISFRRLRVVTPDGAQADDFVNLSRIRIDAP